MRRGESSTPELQKFATFGKKQGFNHRMFENIWLLYKQRKLVAVDWMIIARVAMLKQSLQWLNHSALVCLSHDKNFEGWWSMALKWNPHNWSSSHYQAWDPEWWLVTQPASIVWQKLWGIMEPSPVFQGLAIYLSGPLSHLIPEWLFFQSQM